MKKTQKHPLMKAMMTHLQVVGQEGCLYWITAHVAGIQDRLIRAEKDIDKILQMMQDMMEVEDNILKRLESKPVCTCPNTKIGR